MIELPIPFPKFGAGIGLHRVLALAAALGCDLARFARSACVITGSNGKGSTAAMTAAMLHAANQGAVGLFTSPHLFSVTERFKRNDAEISAAELAPLWSRVEAAARAYEAEHPADHVGGFEFLFLIAALWFAESECAFTVWEAGIGGRYDPTRCIRAPFGVLVSIDLEHTGLLGGTRELIAYDKLDAFPPCACVWHGESLRDLAPRLTAYAALRGLELSAVDPAAAPTVRSLIGDHQRNNAALAAQLARALLSARGIGEAACAAAIAEGAAKTQWPGRMERISAAPLIVIDVGHTPAAVASARSAFERLAAPGILVCGVSVDKDAREVLAILAPGFQVIIAVAARHKGRPAAEIANLAAIAAPQAEICIADGMVEAHRLALMHAHGRSIFVAGGLFVAVEFKAVHEGRPLETLRFF